MAKRVSRKSKLPIPSNAWSMKLVIPIVLLAASYGFISLAIDSGSLLEYAIGVGLLYWAIVHIVRGLKYVLSSKHG